MVFNFQDSFEVTEETLTDMAQYMHDNLKNFKETINYFSCIWNEEELYKFYKCFSRIEKEVNRRLQQIENHEDY